MPDDMANPGQETQDRRQRELDIVKKHSAQLSEHFESVQIFVTKQRKEGTESLRWGDGNWFARYGQIVTWIQEQTPGQADNAGTDHGADNY